MGKSRCANIEMARYAEALLEFQNTNETCHGEWVTDNLYVVFSYGEHFPLYALDKRRGTWWGNKDKPSRTTGRHRSHARPDGLSRIEWRDTAFMKELVRTGGAVEFARWRLQHGRAA